MAQVATAEDFWTHPYTKELTPLGKMSLHYALSFEYENKPIIAEDMALATGQDISVCEDWLEQFTADGMLEGIDG
jgi:hypothetical protein